MRNPLPYFSIIVPTRHRPEQLASCLDALARLDYPRDIFEVIVVDDGSETAPEAVVAAFRDRIDVSLITQAHAGPATARNRGAARAKGEFLAFTDDDCAPAPDWLKKLAVRFAAMPRCLIGGRTINALTDNPYSTASQMLIDYLYAYFKPDTDQGCFFTSNNIALAAAAFRKLGGFDTSFPLPAAEDRDLCDRWRAQYPMIYAPEVVIYHSHTLSLCTFSTQHFNYGRGASYFHQLRAERVHGRLRLEPASFYWNLLKYPLSTSTCQPSVLLIALLILAQGAHAMGFFFDRVKALRKFASGEASHR